MSISRKLTGICCRFCTLLPWIIGFVAISFTANAQPIPEWDRDFGGNNWEELNSIQQTSDEGYIMAGYSSSSANGDVSEATQGLGDFWLVRTDRDGNQLWDRRYGGNGEERPYSVKETSDGGFIVGGWSFSGASGDKTQASRGYFDYWVVKTDGLGNLEWNQTYGGDSTEFLYDLIQTSDGGYLIGGISMSGISGEKTGAGRGNFDYWVIKTDALGVIEWDATYGGSDEERLNTLLEDDDGHFILAGGSRSDIGGDVTTGLLGVKDFWMIKVDRLTGAMIWERRYGGTDEDEISSVVKTADGGYFLGGGSRSDQLPGMKTDNARGIVDMWVVKTDAAGNIEWDKTFGGTNLDNCYSVKQNSIGYYLVGGFSGSPAGGDKTEPPLGGWDFWLIYLDPNGNKLWDKTLGGSGNDVMENLFQTADGGYLMGGHSSSGVDGDKTSANKGLNDFWIIKTRCNLSVDFRDTVVCPNEPIVLNAYDPSCTDCRWIWDDNNTDSIRTISTPVDLTHRVTLTDGVGCARFDDINITVNTPPSLDLGNDYSICEGETTTLDAGISSLDYQWSTLDTLQQIQVDTTGVYRLVVTDSNACTSEDSIRITVNPLPTVFLGNDSTICPNGDLLLDAGNAGARFRWSGNQNSQMLLVNNPGTYAVTVTDANDCSAADTIEIANYDLPLIQNVEAVCNANNTFYTLSFDIANGDTATHVVSGISGQLLNGKFVSDPIPKDALYSISVSDGRACDPEILQGTFNCECVSDAGQLNNNAVTICGASQVSIDPAVSTSLDTNDILQYVLHDGTALVLGNVLATNSQPVFSFMPGMNYGQTYHIAALVGNPTTSAQVDLNDGCLSTSNGVAVVFYDLPEAAIVPQGALVLTCNFPTLVLDGFSSQPVGMLSYLWQTQGEGNIMGDLTAPQVTINAKGTYRLTVTNIVSGCQDTISINVTSEDELPLASIANPEVLNCRDTMITLDASNSSSGDSIRYLWTGGNISGSTLQNPVVDQPGRYTLEVTDRTNGCKASAFVDVHQDIEKPQVDAGAAEQLDCLLSSIELNGSYSSSSTVSIIWQTQDGNILNGEQSLRPTINQPGVYQLQVTNEENACIGTDEVVVILDPDVPTGAAIELTPIVCAGDNDGHLIVESVTGGSAPFMYSLNGSPFSSQNSFSGLSAGQYLLTIEDLNGCQWDTLMTLEDPAPFVVSLGQGTVLALGETIKLRPQANMPISEFRWISADTAFCTNCLSPTVAPANTTIYRLEVTNLTGCTVATSITIGVRKERLVYIPTVFTPNLDGINDRLKIYAGEGVVRIKAFKIFDRWGELVYQQLNTLPNENGVGWDGRFKGEFLNSGVYLYYAEIEFTDGWIELYKGDVSLLR